MLRVDRECCLQTAKKRPFLIGRLISQLLKTCIGYEKSIPYFPSNGGQFILVYVLSEIANILKKLCVKILTFDNSNTIYHCVSQTLR